MLARLGQVIYWAIAVMSLGIVLFPEWAAGVRIIWSGGDILAEPAERIASLRHSNFMWVVLAWFLYTAVDGYTRSFPKKHAHSRLNLTVGYLASAVIFGPLAVLLVHEASTRPPYIIVTVSIVVLISLAVIHKIRATRKSE